MNDKQNNLYQIVDIVVDCCSFEIDGKKSMTKEDLLGKSRSENCVMSRCILAHMILSAGYSITTAALLMHRSQQAVRHLIEVGHNYIQTSRAFRIANAEATLRCKDLAIE